MEDKKPLYLHIVLIALVVPWAIMAAGLTGNADNLWLAEAFLRIASGARMMDAAYEPNPPLALLLYALPASLAAATGWALHHVIFGYTLLVAMLSVWAVHRLLSLTGCVNDGERMVLSYAFLISITLMTTGYFGERDHFVAMALVPFSLMQIILFRMPQGASKALWIVAFAVAPFILLKPLYALLPALLILARLVHTRSPRSIFLSPDFVALGLAGITYGGLLLKFFPDYIYEIFPAVIKYYLPATDYGAVLMIAAQYLACEALTAFFLFLKKPARGSLFFPVFFPVAAIASLVPYLAQGHGYYYHLLPATAFLWMGLGLAIIRLIEGEGLGLSVAKAGTCVLVAVLAYAAKPVPVDFSHKYFQGLALVREAAECGKPHCRVLIFSPRFEMSYLVSYYAGAEYASRFPAFFFLPSMAAGQEDDREKYGQMVAGDLEHYMPDVALIASFPLIAGGEDFQFVDFFSAHPGFSSAWQSYRKTGEIRARIDQYIPDLYNDQKKEFVFEVYRRSGS